ncbi:MAG: hypothetical protein ACYCVU_10240 [Gammaproteobacteria bacterium]
MYGTLKRGYENHARFFKQEINACPAWCPGILFDTPWNHPVARASKGLILAYGTLDVMEDLALQNRFGPNQMKLDEVSVSTNPSRRIQGEALILEDPCKDLPRLDVFEEFSPGMSSSRFQRVLIWIRLQDQWATAWMYAGCSIFENQEFRELTAGYWPEQSGS